MSSLISMEENGTNQNSPSALQADNTMSKEVNRAATGSRRYGSIGTLSTEYISSSSSSSSESQSDNNNVRHNEYHNLSLDLGSTDNSDSSSSSEESTLLPQPVHSRDSSYSDISSDGGGGGYYDRFARHYQRQPRRKYSATACSFIENSILTTHNFKVVFSFVLWFISYMIMGVFGGSVAYLHFERRDASIPDPLPDFGYDVIPVSTNTYHLLFADVSVVVTLRSIQRINILISIHFYVLL